MDRNFLTYYEEELGHIRELAGEFAAMHPTVARNLSLDSVPCADPYVERLLEGVAFLAARTRLKVDVESVRYVRNLLDTLYPDLVGPAPAVSTAVLHPGPQVQTMQDGHLVKRGTRMVAAYRDGVATRATYTTAQDVTLWPIRLEAVEYLQDRGALNAAGLTGSGAEAGLRLVISRTGPGDLSELGLDRLDVNFATGTRGGAIFDAVFGWGDGAVARPLKTGPFRKLVGPEMVGVADGEGLLPRLRPAFEGYRLMREYFLMPDRFHFLRLDGLNPTTRACSGLACEIIIQFQRPRPELADVSLRDFRLFVTPLVNLFEKECNVIEIDGRTTAQVVHPDRTRPRDFEIYQVLRVEDADSSGPDAVLRPHFSNDIHLGSGLVYALERRQRRPGEDETRRGQTRTTYMGDDVFLSVARPADAVVNKSIKRLDIRALCTNRDLPILDDTPTLTLETGDPVGRVELLAAFRRPRASLVAALPRMAVAGEDTLDEVTWRLIGQLSLNHLSLADDTPGAEPLRAMIDLYADRGDPRLSRHARSIVGIKSARLVERLGIPGPICFGHGVEITLDVDEAPLKGMSVLLMSAILNRLFARHAGINSFVRVRTRLTGQQLEVVWPMTLGNRAII